VVHLFVCEGTIPARAGGPGWHIKNWVLAVPGGTLRLGKKSKGVCFGIWSPIASEFAPKGLCQ
jgi:hypothetical protein